MAIQGQYNVTIEVHKMSPMGAIVTYTIELQDEEAAMRFFDALNDKDTTEGVFNQGDSWGLCEDFNAIRIHAHY